MEKGKCCEYCIKHEKPECSVKNAEPWSRWRNFCSEFEGNGKSAMCEANSNAVLAEVRAELKEMIYETNFGISSDDLVESLKLCLDKIEKISEHFR